MDKPCVSVIMPIYNASRYLDTSLGRLVNQTMKDIEIVCVNDGSKDDSLEIIHRYASADPRIKVIDKPNGGYGHAMNAGLKEATGEYIGILEPDDFVEETMFASLYEIAKQNDCDVVKSNYFEYREKTDENQFLEVLWECEYNRVTNSWENEKIVYMRPCIWSAIYRRELLEENHIEFNETPGASYQDTSFAFKVWVCAKRAWFVKDAFLHYRIDNENSSVNSTGKIFSICDEFQSIQSFLNVNKVWREKYLRILQTLKFDAYKWNLDRITPEYKNQFRDQMALEFIKADYDGFLDKTYFDEWRWEELQRIISDYRESERLIHVYSDSYSYKIGHTLLQPLRWVSGVVGRKQG